MTPPRIGFIGLGIMGSAMAKNLLKAGCDVTVWNRDRKKTEEFQALGREAAPTPKALAQRCDVLITMVTGDEAMEAVLGGPDGVFAARFGGSTLINMSTVSSAYCERLAALCFKEAVTFLDCPVAGSKPLAENGTLLVLAGAGEKALEKRRSLLLSMGKAVIHAGPPPAGTRLKLCVNLLLAQMTSGLCESAALAKAFGLDPGLIFRTAEASPALDCGYFRMKKDNILKEEFPPAFALKDLLKDLRYALAGAASRRQELPVTGAVEKLAAKTYNSGERNSDLTAMYKSLLAGEDK
ncbi:MAG: 3-hydroxyisobutyrate dehydrogenase [Elusimicrobia bacterium]|nr:MAG: 3-hydroxyisobutyrate dehydrogenase [Elusimicrobiota bacterium]KAF0154564.1 MAG: 3-hydroxyisobutyrate dehydrogenase [Elusimicrobiota bacterium]